LWATLSQVWNTLLTPHALRFRARMSHLRTQQVLKDAFNLSDGEEKFIVNAKIGQGILVTQEGRIPFYNFLSDEERRLFTTKPKEVNA
jgi:hypothetical protein